jgi:hypothetical protein
MKVIIETESGSVYHLDSNEMAWEKTKYVPGPLAPTNTIRTGGGRLLQWPRFEVGQPLFLKGPSLTPEGDFRLINTSLVTKIIQLDEEGDEPPVVIESPFASLQVGDTVIRMLAGVAPVKMIISDITDELIVCGPWTFDKITGAEIDIELGWGNIITGSFLVPPK